MKDFYILRGTSGSGKTTLAYKLADLIYDATGKAATVAEADHYFYKQKGFSQEVYEFDATKLHIAHQQCYGYVREAMENGEDVILSNTSTKEKDLRSYLDLAREFDYNVISLIVEHRHEGTNKHNVPEETLKKQEQNLRNSIKLR